MARTISIHEVTEDALRGELRYVVQYFRDLGYEECELSFGWRWGMDYPPEGPWGSLTVSLADVETEVRKPEDAGLGEFGRDDVTLRVPPVDAEFVFCHHGGIHLTSSQAGQVATHFLTRWTSAGFAPTEQDLESS